MKVRTAWFEATDTDQPNGCTGGHGRIRHNESQISTTTSGVKVRSAPIFAMATSPVTGVSPVSMRLRLFATATLAQAIESGFFLFPLRPAYLHPFTQAQQTPRVCARQKSSIHF